VLDADIRDGRAFCALGSLALERSCPDGRARVVLRPEQLRLSAPAATGPVARVRSVDFYGHDSRVWLDLPSGLTVSARLEGSDIPAAGDDVTITVRGAVLPFPSDASGPPELPEGTALAGTMLPEDLPQEPVPLS
jgi:iron(III) transport system ATP-binding protein